MPIKKKVFCLLKTFGMTEIGDVIEVEIESWYREFDCSDELSVWIPENLKEYQGDSGLDKEDIKKIKRLAQCALRRVYDNTKN